MACLDLDLPYDALRVLYPAEPGFLPLPAQQQLAQLQL